jgi:alkylation response protein AidB-like acyl-CoA dehydrogenase
VVIAEELGRMGIAGVAIGVSLHMESVLSILVRFGHSPLLRRFLDGAIAGELIGCLAASEPTGGSDLMGTQTILERRDGGWHLRGEKKFVSLSTVADFSLVLCRAVGDTDQLTDTPRVTMVLVPREHMRIRRVLQKAGAMSLETAWVSYDTPVPDDAVVGRVGGGLLAVTHGLTHERFAIAAQLVGACQLATGLAAAHLRRRQQFGVPLMEHQALRLRLADLVAKTEMMRLAVRGAASEGRLLGAVGPRTVAGLKVTAARMGGEIVSECMHLFGGAGYLDDETPMARLWRDVRLARIGAGTDEMMWEMVAGGLVADDQSYDEMVRITW